MCIDIIRETPTFYLTSLTVPLPYFRNDRPLSLPSVTMLNLQSSPYGSVPVSRVSVGNRKSYKHIPEEEESWFFCPSF